MDIFGIILGGGGGTRLGGVNKSNLRLHNHTLLELISERLDSQCQKKALIGASSNAISTGLPVVQDVFNPAIGPLGGIYTGALWAKEQATASSDCWILTAPVDGPLFPIDFVQRVCERGSPAAPLIARFGDNLYPVCGLWPLDKALQIAELHSRQVGNAIRPVLRALSAQEIDFQYFCDQNPFLNANNVADLLTLSERLSAQKATR